MCPKEPPIAGANPNILFPVHRLDFLSEMAVKSKYTLINVFYFSAWVRLCTAFTRLLLL